MTKAPEQITLLHLSDVQFGRNHRFGSGESAEKLVEPLKADLSQLAKSKGIEPDLVVLTGDLADLALPDEFDQVHEFIQGLAVHLRLPSSRIALVPGNHDINRDLCQSHFNRQKGLGAAPVPPYWVKWEPFKERLFDRLYPDGSGIGFTAAQPWTLFEVPDLRLVIAGLNSTLAESHQDSDHYGWLGETQLQWFAERLAPYKEQGWVRIGALHHNVLRGDTADDENLRDAEDLRRYLVDTDLLNLVLHGHTHTSRFDWWTPTVPILSTGSAALTTAPRPPEVPNQYQLVRIDSAELHQWCRAYAPTRKRFEGDNSAARDGNDWRRTESVAWVAGPWVTTDDPNPLCGNATADTIQVASVPESVPDKISVIAAATIPIDPADLRNWIDPIRLVYHDQPYPDVRGTLCPPDFYGRQKEKKEVIGRFYWPENRRPIIIQGEWCMGKTSMLKLIEKTLKNDTDALPVRLSDGGLLRAVQDVFLNMSQALLQVAECAQRDVNPSQEYPGPEAALRELYKLVRRCAPDKRVIYIIDEWDECIDADVDAVSDRERCGILRLFKDIVNSDLPIYLLLSTTRPSDRFRNNDVKIFVAESCWSVSLEPFEDDENYAAMVRGLFNESSLITTDQLTLFHRQSGGWPFFTKTIRWYLDDILQGLPQLHQAIEQAARDRKGKLGEAMTQVFERYFDEEEKHVAVRLASARGPVSEEHFAKQSVGIQRPGSLPEVAKRLESRHYVKTIDGSFDFQVAMLRDWFLHCDKWAEISRDYGIPSVQDPTGSTQKRRFRVALSYASERRTFFRKVVSTLLRTFPEEVLGDGQLQAEHSRADLPAYLAEQYRKDSDLIVVFASEKYAGTKWSGRECEAILDLTQRRPESVMLFRLDETELPGLDLSGAILIKRHGSSEIVTLIRKRWSILSRSVLSQTDS